MPIVKFIKGLAPSCEYIAHYLTRDGRALASDFVNIAERTVDDKTWWEEMDETREVYGNAASPDDDVKVRTYQHIIISTDPNDSQDLDQFRDYVTKFANEVFGDHQVAIYYHDDNRTRVENGEKGILHAHLIVNNTNMETGRRIAPWLTRQRVAKIKLLANDLGATYGYRYLDPKDIDNRGWARQVKSDETKLEDSNGTDGELSSESQRKQGTRSNARRSSRTIDQNEAVKRDGFSWKEEIRNRVDIARETARSVREFEKRVQRLGISLKENKYHEYVFTHPGKDTWKVSGPKLGRLYTRESIERACTRNAMDANSGTFRVSDSVFERIATALEHDDALTQVLTRGRGAREGSTGTARGVAVVSGEDAGTIDARDVSAMLVFNREHGIVKDEDYERYDSEEAREARRVANRVGYFKLETGGVDDKVAGERIPKSSLRESIEYHERQGHTDRGGAHSETTRERDAGATRDGSDRERGER